MSVDYYVTCREKAGGRITRIRRHTIDNDGTWYPRNGEMVARTTVVKDVDNGWEYWTVYYNDGWKLGAMIEIVVVDGTKYLKTKKNNKPEDNLGALPNCES